MKALNEFGYDEVVDTLSDLINAVVGFLATIKGGFNLITFLNWTLKEYPNLREVIEDFGTFTLQLGDLTPQEALNAAGEIDAKTPDHPVANKIVNVLKLFAVTYDYFSKTVATGKAIVEMAKSIFVPKAA